MTADNRLPNLFKGAALIAAFFLLGCKPAAQANTKNLKSWAYLIPASFYASGFESRLKNYYVLCLGVYRLDQAGNLYLRPKLTGKQWQQLGRLRKGRKLYPLISLRSARAGANMLADATARSRAIAKLSALMQQRNYDGMHIDFEYLTDKHRPNFKLFLGELKKVMKDKTLSIAAFPPFYGRPDEAAFHDVKDLKDVIDEVMYMTYDYHKKKPGPVTHLGWVEKNIREGLKHISAERIWLGIPGYGYEWQPPKTRPRALSQRATKQLCTNHRCMRHDSGMLKLTRPGKIAYLMDYKMHHRLVKLAQHLGVRGWALWRIGFEELP